MVKSQNLVNAAMRLRPEDYKWFSACMRVKGRKVMSQWQMFQLMREAFIRVTTEGQKGGGA